MPVPIPADNTLEVADRALLRPLPGETMQGILLRLLTSEVVHDVARATVALARAKTAAARNGVYSDADDAEMDAAAAESAASAAGADASSGTTGGSVLSVDAKVRGFASQALF
jgi:hypothetical protein